MEFEKSSIERLKRTLYSRNENVIPKEKRTPVSGRETDVPKDWGTPPSFDISNETMIKHNNSFFNKFLIGSIIFFLVALGIAVFIFFGGLNMISSNNLDIKIVAPSSISSGEELIMGLSIVNSNRTDLESVDFFIDYPDGAVSVGEGEPLTREKIDLETIPSGESKNYTVRTVLSGEKEAIKSFKFRIEYRVKNSNATFSKEKTYEVVINSSPIILNVSYPKEINSGQNMTLVIDLVSNSSIVLKNSLIRIEYPYGFTYKDSNIKPLRDNSVWNVGDLKDGDKKTLSVTGVLVGQNLEDRTFNIRAGIPKLGETSDFDIPLATGLATIGIRKTFFDLNVVADTVSSFGRLVIVNVKWQNILPDNILNTRVSANISGSVFDRTTVKANNGGFFRSTDDTVIWDKNSTSNLAIFSPGDSGDVSFSFYSFPNSVQIKSIKNPHINIKVKLVGDRSGSETSTISTEETITIKFPSTITFGAKSFRSVGPFVNTGSIPPKADKESTYTVTWTITNANNDLKDSTVTAVLPAGVEWKNETFPSNERLVFNPETRVVTWNIGNISSGTGFTYSPKEVSFKVGIVPSVSQVGSNPDLVTGIKLSTADTYTETQVVIETQAVTTQFSDPSYVHNESIVGQ